MAGRRHKRRSSKLFLFDQPFLTQYGVIAGVDEAGRGPLAGPVVAAAIMLPSAWRHTSLNDSKKLLPSLRAAIFKELEACAISIGVGIVEPDEIDRINIHQAGFKAMRIALSQLSMSPVYTLVDGFTIPQCHHPNRGIVGGDGLSAHIAAASVIAKVTRDTIMMSMDKAYPEYGFCRHKGYGTAEHLKALARFGPTRIHRKSFSPVSTIKPPETILLSE